MPPNYSKYKKTFRKEWLSLPVFKGWLLQNTSDPDRAFCSVCNTSLRAHKTDLETHSKKPKHKLNFSRMNPAKSQTTLQNITIISNETKRSELVIAAHIAVHSSIRTVDHLSNILQKEFRPVKSAADSSDIKLHRTKCSMLIKNVIGATLKEQLVADIGDSPFSLIIDESTDVSVHKYLCLCIRYFSKTHNKMTTTFLGIVNIISATAVALAEVIQNEIRNVGLKIENMIGLGTDGASVLCGQHNSVFTILKAVAPRLLLVKCVAHSLHLCCSEASNGLPDELDFLCKQIYNWFARSCQRRDGYKEIFNLINLNENVKFHNFIELSDTRWLVRGNVIKVILEQWLELETYFSDVARNTKDSMAKIINEMLTDSNFVYFTIVQNIIIQFNIVNAAFQQTNADAFKLYTEVYRLLLTMLRLVIKPIFLENLTEMRNVCFQKISDILDNELSYTPLNILDFGYNYREALTNKNLSLAEIENIKKNCQTFILSLCRELTKRLPANLEVFNSIKHFCPEFCLQKINRPSFSALPLDLLPDHADKQLVENEWNNVISVNWENVANISSQDFWIKAIKYQNAGGEHIFKNIAEFALTALTMPISNAFVERMFSFMNIMKTKIRNKMNVPLLDALLRIKTEFVINNMCCENFEPTKEMFQKFNTSMYTFKNKRDEDELFDVFPDVMF